MPEIQGRGACLRAFPPPCARPRNVSLEPCDLWGVWELETRRGPPPPTIPIQCFHLVENVQKHVPCMCLTVRTVWTSSCSSFPAKRYQIYGAWYWVGKYWGFFSSSVKRVPLFFFCKLSNFSGMWRKGFPAQIQQINFSASHEPFETEDSQSTSQAQTTCCMSIFQL